MFQRLFYVRSFKDVLCPMTQGMLMSYESQTECTMSDDNKECIMSDDSKECIMSDNIKSVLCPINQRIAHIRGQTYVRHRQNKRFFLTLTGQTFV